MHVGAVGKQALANLNHLRAIATDERHLHRIDDFDQLDKWARYVVLRMNKEYEHA